MSALFMAVGTCTLGQREVDKDGNVVKETQAKFEPDPKGGCVIVGRIKFTDDGMEQDGPADVFGDWDAGGYLRKALEVIKPSRRHNLPDFERIVKGMVAESSDKDCPFFEHCSSMFCRDCVVNQWIEEVTDE